MSYKNILLAAMSLDYGGAETHVVDLAIELEKKGSKVTVASAGGRLVPRLTAAGIPHYVVPMNSRSPISILSAISTLRTIVAGRDIHLMHAHGRIPAWVLSRLQTYRRLPLVTTYHGVYAAGFPWNIFTRQGDIAIAVSEDVKAHFVQKLQFDSDRVTVIPNGIDTERFAPAPFPELRNLLTTPGARLITHVSRLDEFSDIALSLVSALPDLDKAYPGICCVIVGDGDRMALVSKACEEMNARLGRRAAVAAGGQHDVAPYLLSADVVVAVARAALEAMSCGKPVIFAGEGGLRGGLTDELLPELKRHNFTARGGNRQVTPEALGAAISAMLSSPKDMERAGAIGRGVVTSEYSWDALIPRIIKVYDEAKASSLSPKK